MQKDDVNVHVFPYKSWYNPKSDQWFFFLTWTVRGAFHRKDLQWKKIWGYKVNFWKKQVLYAELNERAEAAKGSYSVTCNSLQPIKKFSSWIFLHRYFLTVLIMVTEQVYKEKFFLASSIIYGCGYYFYY